MSYQNIIQAGLIRLDTKRQLEALDAERQERENQEVIAAYNRQAILYAGQIIDPALMDFLTVTSTREHWGYAFSLVIPDCNEIAFQITQEGKLNKYTTRGEPKLMAEKDRKNPWIAQAHYESYTDLEIAIALAFTNCQLEKTFKAEVEAARAEQTEPAQPATLPTFEEIKQVLLDEDYAQVIRLCQLHL